MPNNFKQLKKSFEKMIGNIGQKTKANKFNLGSVNDINRTVNNKSSERESNELISGGMVDMQAMIATRFMELLSIETPKRKGFLNGGWTSSPVEITDRVNLSSQPISSEIENIISLSEQGNIVIDIRNGVEYARYVNYGTNRSEARMFVELAIAQLQRELRSQGSHLNARGN